MIILFEFCQVGQPLHRRLPLNNYQNRYTQRMFYMDQHENLYRGIKSQKISRIKSVSFYKSIQ